MMLCVKNKSKPTALSNHDEFRLYNFNNFPTVCGIPPRHGRIRM